MKLESALFIALLSANVPPDKAQAVVDALEKQLMDQVATKHDIELLAQAVKSLEASFDLKLKALEHGLTLKIGGMLLAAVTLLTAIQKLLA